MIQMISDIINSCCKSDSDTFWQTNCHLFYSKNTIISLEYVDFWSKILLFRTRHWRNSITELTLVLMYWSGYNISRPNLFPAFKATMTHEHVRSFYWYSKGQLISKCLFGVIVWTKKTTKIFPGFLP